MLVGTNDARRAHGESANNSIDPMIGDLISGISEPDRRGIPVNESDSGPDEEVVAFPGILERRYVADRKRRPLAAHWCSVRVPVNNPTPGAIWRVRSHVICPIEPSTADSISFVLLNRAGKPQGIGIEWHPAIRGLLVRCAAVDFRY